MKEHKWLYYDPTHKVSDWIKNKIKCNKYYNKIRVQLLHIKAMLNREYIKYQ